MDLFSGLPEGGVCLWDPDLWFVVEAVESVLLGQIAGDSDDQIGCHSQLRLAHKHTEKDHEREHWQHQAQWVQSLCSSTLGHFRQRTLDVRFQVFTLHWVGLL